MLNCHDHTQSGSLLHWRTECLLSTIDKVITPDEEIKRFRLSRIFEHRENDSSKWFALPNEEHSKEFSSSGE